MINLGDRVLFIWNGRELEGIIKTGTPVHWIISVVEEDGERIYYLPKLIAGIVKL